MRDLDITNRDLFGNVTFKIKSSYVNGIETLIQKVTTLLLSNTKDTYFGTVYGSDIVESGKYNYNNIDGGDFKIVISNNLFSIKKAIQKDEVKYNIPFEDRLKNIEIKDILFDKKLLKLSVSLIVSTNSATKIIQLPVK